MNINRTRGILAAAVVASLVLPGAAFNAIAARRTTAYAGSVTVHSPVKGEMIRRATTVEWSWRAGTYVKSTSRVDILASDGYQWYPVAISVPIRDGRFDWDTSAWPDEDYVVRVQVQRTTIRGTSAAFYIDNTAPSARISRPSQGEVLIENDTRIFFASVVGTARLEADVRDNLTGVKKVRWLLDGEQIGVGNPYTHNFSLTPGRHELTAISTDGAGNDSAPSTIVILCLPGPSITEAVTPPALPTPGGLPSGDDLPDADDLPSPGSLPDPGSLPGGGPGGAGGVPNTGVPVSGGAAPKGTDSDEIVIRIPNPVKALPN